MLTVDDFGRIRRAHRDGLSIREIARTFHHSRRKIRQVLRGPAEPEAYSPRKRQSAPKLGPLHEVIRQLLKEDETAPPKQRHTMMRLFERLRDEHGYEGGYDAVRRFVRQIRQADHETFIPLDHQPGQRMEADFGEIQVDFPAGRRKVNVLILVWSYSNAPFAIALPTQRTEAILEGMAQAFEFFEAVPKEVWWDNPKTVATAIFRGRSRQLNRHYAALASHFVFDPLFCLPAKGNEKPVVENRVKTLQRKWATPVPQVKDWEELNAYLRKQCREDQERTSSGKSETIGTRLEREKQQATALPPHRFDPCIRQAVKVNKYQLARFDNVDYSVPRQAAFQTVTVKAYVDRVEIVLQEAVIAVHERSYESGHQILDPRHYLAALGRRPAAIDHANVYRDWKLPSVFDELRQRLENRHGPRAGVRQYIRVLQLLAEHPLDRVRGAIEQLRGQDGADAERIIRRVERTAEYAQSKLETSASLAQDELCRPEVLSVQVPCPSLDHFDLFLSPHGGDEDGREEGPKRNAAAEQPEAATVADDPGGAREAGPGGECQQSDVRAVSVELDRIGGGSPGEQRLNQPHPGGQLSGGEGSGELRLLGRGVAQQAESSGIGPVSVDFAAGQCLPTGPARDR